APICDASNDTCGACSGGAGETECQGRSSRHCESGNSTNSALNGQCVVCRHVDSDCGTTLLICDTSTDACGKCTSGGQDTVCATNHPTTPLCDTNADANNGACVGCRGNANCTVDTPICTSNSCV